MYMTGVLNKRFRSFVRHNSSRSHFIHGNAGIPILGTCMVELTKPNCLVNTGAQMLLSFYLNDRLNVPLNLEENFTLINTHFHERSTGFSS